MNIPQQRDVSIDVARGIAIILVVFGHTFQNYSVTSYVYAFHMPLFFLLSGYTFNFQKYQQQPLRYFKKNVMRLLIPYFTAAIISYVLYVWYAPILSLPLISANDAALGIMSGNGVNLPFNNVLWFLPAFFLAGLIFFALSLTLASFRLLAGATMFSILGIMIGLNYHLPWGLDIALTMQFFVCCGYLFKVGYLSEKLKKIS